MRSRGCALRRKPRGTCTAPKSSRSSLSQRQRRRPRRRQLLSRSSPQIHKSSTCRHMTPGWCTDPGLTRPIRPITGTRLDTWPVQGCSRSRRDLSLGPRSGATATGEGATSISTSTDTASSLRSIGRISGTPGSTTRSIAGVPRTGIVAASSALARGTWRARRRAKRFAVVPSRDAKNSPGVELIRPEQDLESAVARGLARLERPGPFPALGMALKHGPTAIADFPAAAVGVDFPVTAGVLGVVGVDFPEVAGAFHVAGAGDGGAGNQHSHVER